MFPKCFVFHSKHKYYMENNALYHLFFHIFKDYRLILSHSIL